MEIYQIAIVPLIVGVVELLKGLGLPTKFSALASALFGIIVGVVYIHPNEKLKGIIIGLSYGLSASGLYSGTKNTIQGIKEINTFKRS